MLASVMWGTRAVWFRPLSLQCSREKVDIYVQKAKVYFQSSQMSLETSTQMKIVFKKKKKEDKEF